MEELIERKSLGVVAEDWDQREDVKITYKWEEDQSSPFITVFTYACWIILFVVLLKIVF